MLVSHNFSLLFNLCYIFHEENIIEEPVNRSINRSGQNKKIDGAQVKIKNIRSPPIFDWGDVW